MKYHVCILFICVLLTAGAQNSLSTFLKPVQEPSHKRLALVGITEGVLFSGTVIGLNELWYKDYPRSGLHLFNDSKEWLQMDKVGHFTTSYYLGKLGIDVWRWAGQTPNKSILYGGLTGLIFTTSVEVLDGFSAQWGFSLADMTANSLGTALVMSEALVWGEQRIQPKFSFHRSKYADYRPNLFGSNVQESILKDYNGQTYWLSGNISSFRGGKGRFKWLNVAVGYGVEGLTGGILNPLMVNGKSIPEFKRERQFYLSVDADLTKIKTRSSFLKFVFRTVGFIKIPAPALEIRSSGVSFHFLYF